ncbi:MAG: PhzF family phenazine biosynthesis protein [Candidatus Thorarchaeota archaeon]|jgi:trans-2,3-dihydro-3-hydroxyanthranilate isomerase
MRAYPYVQTSVFTDNRYSFSGNQLATFWDMEKNQELSDDEMQGMTLEFNFSETTFVLTSEESHCAARVRIFTPAMEIPFAGHPTLGTAFVMKHRGLLPEEMERATLQLGIGPTPVEYLSSDTILMEQKKPEFLSEFDDREAIASAIQLDASDVLDKNPIQFVSTGHPFLMVEVRSLQAVQDAVPSPSGIVEAFSDQPSQELVILSTETIHDDSSVHARMFAPAAGVLEDPATGSAAGPLGAYVERYNILERHEIGAPVVIEQGFEIKRPSRLVSEVIGGSAFDGMKVSGQIRLIAEGEFYL